MKGIPFPNLEIMLVEVIGIVSHLPDLVANLGILGVIVPGDKI